jgi:hypothetical protein
VKTLTAASGVPDRVRQVAQNVIREIFQDAFDAWRVRAGMHDDGTADG